MGYFESYRHKNNCARKADDNRPLHFHRSEKLLYLFTGKKTSLASGKKKKLRRACRQSTAIPSAF